MKKLKVLLILSIVLVFSAFSYADGISITPGHFAKKGANSDITSLTGLTTPLTQAQGGTGGTSLTQQNILSNTSHDAFSNSNGLFEVTSRATPVLDGANAALVNNLVSNGAFDSAITGWIDAAGSSASVAGGKTGNCLEVTHTGGLGIVWRNVTTEIGKLYQFTYYIKAGTEASYLIRLGATGIQSTEYLNQPGEAAADWTTTTQTVTFRATSTATAITLYIDAAGGPVTLLYDSITLYEVTPGNDAADALAFDGHSKTSTLETFRYLNSDNSFGKGQFLNQLEKGAATAEYYNYDRLLGLTYQDLQGRPVVAGCWVYSVTAADNIKLSIHDGVSEIALSTGFVAADTLTWVEVTGTVAATATKVQARVLCDGDSADVAYVSHPILIKGDYIGEGNYSRPSGEPVNCEKTIALTNYTASAVAADATINLEAQSSGKIGKGIKAVHGYIEGQNSAADKYVDILSASGGVRASRTYCQVAGKDVAQQFRAVTDANGDIYIDVEDGNWTNVTIEINAIELR